MLALEIGYTCFAIDATKRDDAEKDVLSAGKERVLLGHDISVLPFGAELPRAGHDAQHDDTRDGRVGPPIGRLRVPTTGRRPDVLGIPREIGTGVRAGGFCRIVSREKRGGELVGLKKWTFESGRTDNSRDFRTATL